MFEDSLIESGGRLSSKRGATTVVSFVLQALLLGILILIPLIYTEALPKQQLMTSSSTPRAGRASISLEIARSTAGTISGRLSIASFRE